MIAWAVQALVATSILMALVLALRRSVARAFGPGAAYALWALPALRMVMPSLPGWRALYVPVWHIAPDHSVVGIVDPLQAAHYAAVDHLAALAPIAPLAPLASLSPLAPLAAVPVEALPVSTLLLVLWLAGALVWFGWQMLRYQGFLRGALRSATLLTTECGVDVLLTDAVDGPVAAGILRKRIFLPADFLARYGSRERRLALLHEGAHHDRRDIVANFVALMVLALHWWNPLAHRAYRRFRADQELACDATVLAGVGREDRHAYGSAVLKSASARMPGVACALSHKDELKRRLQEMARKPLGSPRQWAGIGVAIAATLTGLAFTASGHATTPPTSALLSQADIDQIEADAQQARADALQARADAAQSRRDALDAAAEARRDAEDGRRAGLAEAEEARREAERSRQEALRDAAQSRRDAMREAAEARRSALIEARRAAEEGRQEAERARAEGLRQADRAHFAAGEAGRQIALTRQHMAANCASKGRIVSSTLSFDRLALCGDSAGDLAHREIARALHDSGMD
jgi:beta-lactamase regulating signal transducer with metallopeptidase domain